MCFISLMLPIAAIWLLLGLIKDKNIEKVTREYLPVTKKQECADRDWLMEEGWDGLDLDSISNDVSIAILRRVPTGVCSQVPAPAGEGEGCALSRVYRDKPQHLVPHLDLFVIWVTR
ncbi:hypothetical protein BDV98DRAFT_585930 [Pterulicium gracile]|uniref:Uncharacterized protein n=1 Tax=Pterulicium gracile TaxID=1884261 RepID=A0A5C3Q7T4_9AGAR|nr:hypothetical protein BDV98DRAFT_585930 [Pterula gracilis]